MINFQNVSKIYGSGSIALDNINLVIKQNEFVSIVGKNGAGKSTLIRIMTGAEQADAGTLAVSGRTVPSMTPALARSLGIVAIYQQPSLFPHLSVAENIALSLEAGGVWRRVRWSE